MVQRFKLEIVNIVRKTKRKQDTVVREVIMDISEEILRRTPVDTGFLRGSWFLTIGEPPKTEKGSVARSQTAAGEIAIAASQLKAGDRVFFLNQAEYAGAVEHGTSRMAPRGFVKSTLSGADQIIEGTIRRIAVT